MRTFLVLIALVILNNAKAEQDSLKILSASEKYKDQTIYIQNENLSPKELARLQNSRGATIIDKVMDQVPEASMKTDPREIGNAIRKIGSTVSKDINSVGGSRVGHFIIAIVVYQLFGLTILNMFLNLVCFSLITLILMRAYFKYRKLKWISSYTLKKSEHWWQKDQKEEVSYESVETINDLFKKNEEYSNDTNNDYGTLSLIVVIAVLAVIELIVFI